MLMLTLGFAAFYLYLGAFCSGWIPMRRFRTACARPSTPCPKACWWSTSRVMCCSPTRVFRGLHPSAERRAHRQADQGPGLVDRRGGRGSRSASVDPRDERAKRPSPARRSTSPRTAADPVKIVINCSRRSSTIARSVRGCLITFDDLTMVEHMNQALLDSVAKLEVAKRQDRGAERGAEAPRRPRPAHRRPHAPRVPGAGAATLPQGDRATRQCLLF